MKSILIDGFNLGLEKGTGVATYARNLSYCTRNLNYKTSVLYDAQRGPKKVPLLQEVYFFDPHEDKSGRWDSLGRFMKEGITSFLPTHARPVEMSGAVISKQYQSRLPYFDQIINSPDVFSKAQRHFWKTEKIWPSRLKVTTKEKPDIAHWTYPIPIRMAGAKNIYTLHDLVPLRLPFTTLDRKRVYYKMCRLLAHQADHIVTVSETSRNDIINLLGVPEEKVTNTYQAVEIPEKYASKDEDLVRREVKGSFNLDYKEYMMFFGAIEPKKNVGRLIEAYLTSNIDTPLVIVGKMAWKSEQEMKLINDEAISHLEQVGSSFYRRKKIIQLDYAPFPVLVSLIKGAKAVCFPSLYEGFGLPVLEAMKLGTPVLTATTGSLPEVAGDAALMVDPYDTRAISEGIVALDSNPELRAKLSALGKKQADLFSMDAYEKRMAELYEKI